MDDAVVLREYGHQDRHEVAALWNRVFPGELPRNAPRRVIDEKALMKDGLFFVAVLGSHVVGTVMAGYDGHRGWVYRLAVLPEYRGKGIAARLMRKAEAALVACGCAKVNLQVREGNETVVGFYRSLGYEVEERISLGRVLETAVPANGS